MSFDFFIRLKKILEKICKVRYEKGDVNIDIGYIKGILRDCIIC